MMISAWRRSGNTRPVKYREFFAAATCLAVLGALIINIIQSVSDDNARQDRVAADQRIYDAQVQTYHDSLAARTLCFVSVQASLNNRAMWQRTVNLLDEAGLDSASAYLADGPLLRTPAADATRCGAPPVAPERPASLGEDPSPTTQPPDPVITVDTGVLGS